MQSNPHQVKQRNISGWLIVSSSFCTALIPLSRELNRCECGYRMITFLKSLDVTATDKSDRILTYALVSSIVNVVILISLLGIFNSLLTIYCIMCRLKVHKQMILCSFLFHYLS
jgi:hypothetical protein